MARTKDDRDAGATKKRGRRGNKKRKQKVVRDLQLLGSRPHQTVKPSDAESWVMDPASWGLAAIWAPAAREGLAGKWARQVLAKWQPTANLSNPNLAGWPTFGKEHGTMSILLVLMIRNDLRLNLGDLPRLAAYSASTGGFQVAARDAASTALRALGSKFQGPLM